MATRTLLFDLARLDGVDTTPYRAQVQVSRYLEGPGSFDAQGRFLQTVQIEIIDRSSQSVRTIVDQQVWRHDPEALTWWLESGLPELD